MFNGWLSVPVYKEYVKEQWGNIQVTGWAAFVAKEKLKELKKRLRSSSNNHVGDVEKKVVVLQEELTSWDIKGEGSALAPDELAHKKACVAELISAKKKTQEHNDVAKI